MGSQRVKESKRRRDEETGRSLPQPLPKGKGFGAALMHRTQGDLGSQRDKETKRQRVKEAKRQRGGETKRQRVKETERRRDEETGRRRGGETKRQRGGDGLFLFYCCPLNVF